MVEQMTQCGVNAERDTTDTGIDNTRDFWFLIAHLCAKYADAETMATAPTHSGGRKPLLTPEQIESYHCDGYGNHHHTAIRPIERAVDDPYQVDAANVLERSSNIVVAGFRPSDTVAQTDGQHLISESR